MELLKELATVVTKNKAKQISIIGQDNSGESKVQQLYRGIITDSFKDEDAAAKSLFPESENQKSNFNKLKRALHRRLLNTLFFVDVNQPGFTEVLKAYYTCQKDYAALKILMGRSAHKTALPLAEKILRNALKYEFTDLTVNVLRELRPLYVSMKANRKKLDYCNSKLSEHIDILQAELQAEEYYHNLAIHFVKSKATIIELGKIARKYAKELEPMLSKFSSHRFLLLAYSVFSLRYEVINDYRNTLKVCEEAVRLFEKKGELVPKTNVLQFLRKTASCHIQLGNYEKGERVLLRCLKGEEVGKTNWYTTCERYLILLLHSRQYQKSFKIFLEAFYHPGLKRISPAFQERWKLYEAFIHYFIATGVIEPGLKEGARLGKFKLRKFLNDMPEFSKDKRGGNITILILQILFLLQTNRYDDAIPRLEALNAYSYRYLRKNDTFRSNCFIHMLSQVPQSYFNKKAVSRKARKYVDKLKEMPLAEARQSGELEPVPYEHLWGFVLASLKG
jgi:tetratricopeptide (TPR) repeat protein